MLVSAGRLWRFSQPCRAARASAGPGARFSAPSPGTRGGAARSQGVAPSGSGWSKKPQAGVQGLGAENIARGQADARAVMEGWMNSEGHRANILNCDYKTIGIGVHEGSGGPWWVQNFGF